MTTTTTGADFTTRRILAVDDNLAIHEDYRKILVEDLRDRDMDAMEAELFGASSEIAGDPLADFQIDFAAQGFDALEMVENAVRQACPYSLAFVDVRMPPGWDGVETVSRMWKVDPRLQVVLCTAYSDHSWQDIVRQLGKSDRLLILKKPFDGIEIRQLALTLTTKWIMQQNAEATMQDLLNRLAMAGDALAA